MDWPGYTNTSLLKWQIPCRLHLLKYFKGRFIEIELTYCVIYLSASRWESHTYVGYIISGSKGAIKCMVSWKRRIHDQTVIFSQRRSELDWREWSEALVIWMRLWDKWHISWFSLNSLDHSNACRKVVFLTLLSANGALTSHRRGILILGMLSYHFSPACECYPSQPWRSARVW